MSVIGIKVDKALENPYKIFYEKYRKDKLGIEDEAKPDNYEDYVDHEFDPEFVQAYFDEIFKDAEKKKSIHIHTAMKYDPAFMLYPIEQHYMKLIPEKIKERLSEKDIQVLLEMLDPVTWGQRYLLGGKWRPRASKRGVPYQSMLIRCKAKQMTVRAGRRTGKTCSLVVRILHKAFNWTPEENGSKKTFNIVIFTPNQSQVNVIFKMFEVFIDNNPHLMSMIKDRKIPTRKTPQTELELLNGVTIRGFVSGSASVRGSAADMLILDEASFLTTDDTDSVIALLNEGPDVELWLSSTPKGLKDYFYDRCEDPKIVDFHFPTDKFHPAWNQEMEETFRSQLTNSGYNFEVLATFASDGEGVFQKQFVEQIVTEYELGDYTYDPTWIYAIGCDWNDVANGTQIAVIGFNPHYIKEGTKPYTLVDKASVSIDGWTQITAVNTIIEFNRKWNAHFVYVDSGHGGAQIELLHDKGRRSLPNTPDFNLTKAKSINFSTTIEVTDPWTMQRNKKPMKNYMVNNSVRVVEEFLLQIPKSEIKLRKQMEGYRIGHISPNGIPRYIGDPKEGDHMLDALMLALLSFHMEYGELVNPNIEYMDIGSVESFGKPVNYSGREQKDRNLSDQELLVIRDKVLELEEVALSGGRTSANTNQSSILKRGQSPVNQKRKSFIHSSVSRRRL